MPGSGVHYGLRIFSTDSLIEEIKPGTGDSCALCLDSIQEEGGEKPGDLKGGNCIEQSEEGSHKIRDWWEGIIRHEWVQFNYDEVWSIALITGVIVTILILFYHLIL